MNASGIPRFKNRGKKEILGRMMEINTEHIAYLLHTLYSKIKQLKRE